GGHSTDESAGRARHRGRASEYMVVRTLVGEEEQPAARGLGPKDLDGLFEISWAVPPYAKQHRARGPGRDDHAVAVIVVVVERARIAPIHSADGCRIDHPGRAPAGRFSIRQDLPRAIVRPPRAGRRRPDDPAAGFPLAPSSQSANPRESLRPRDDGTNGLPVQPGER